MAARPTGTVTFVFTDVEASTELWERDPDGMRVALEAHDEVVRSAMAAFGGYVFATGGDGFGVAFTRAGDACFAAVEAQRRLGLIDWPEHAPIGARIGIHTGEAFERDGDYFGPAVNRTARVAAAANARQIVMSLATEQVAREHLPPDHSLVDLGILRLVGVTAPLRVFGLVAPGMVTVFPPLRHTRDAPGNLSQSVARLVGRHDAIGQLVERLRSDRLVTLTGVGGVGKTSLALTVASAMTDRFPDGSWWVELAAVNRAGDVASAVAATIGVQPQANTSPTDSVVAALTGRRSLLVLDNCEHVVAAAGEFVEALQRRVPTVTMLITSRERLGVAGETVEPVRPLDSDGVDSPAVELFLDRLGARDLDDDDRAAVLEICAHLDGLPLGIELAASRCRQLRPTDVATRLGARLALLADPHRRVDRQRTLDATLRWSYELLTPVEQRLLRHLAVFVGGFTLDALESVCTGDGLADSDLVDLLASLADKSLIERTSHGYRLLETTSGFALEQLAVEEDAVETLRSAHAAYFVHFAMQCRVGLRGDDEGRWVARLDADWANVRTAFRFVTERGDLDAVTSIVTALMIEGFWRRPEVFEWADDAYQEYASVEHSRRHELAGAAGWASWGRGDIDECLRRAREAVALRGGAPAVDNLPEWAEGGGLAWCGHTAESNDVMDGLVAEAREHGDRWLESVTLASRALGSIMLGHWDESVTTARAAIEAAQANPTARAYAFWILGVGLTSRDRTEAWRSLEHALELADSVHNSWQHNIILSALATLVAAGEEPERALGTLAQSVDDLWRAGYRTHGWNVCSQTVPVLTQMGRLEDAAVVLGANRSHSAGGMANVARLLDKADARLRAELGQRVDTLAARGASMTAPSVMAILRRS